MRLDVVSVVDFDFGKVFQLRFDFRAQRVHEGTHPLITGKHALPGQACQTEAETYWL